MHSERSVRQFVADLAAETPTPGGGGAAALAGALGAGLVAMVCNYTIGRKRYASVEAEFRALLARSEAIRAELLDLVESDAEAYQTVVDAQARPKDSPDYAERVQQALGEAIRVPLRVAVLAADVLALCEPVAERGNRNLVSDAGVAALLADAALGAAVLNVRTNLTSVTDDHMRAENQAAVSRLLGAALDVKPRVMAIVQSKVG